MKIPTLLLAGALAGCGASSPASTAPVHTAEVVDPDLGNIPTRGGLQPMNAAAAAPVDEPIADDQPIVPIDLDEFEMRQELTLVDGRDLVVDGLALRSIPEGHRVFRVRSLPETFSIEDASGGRIAVIERADWRYVSQPGGQPIGPVQVRERTLQLQDWGEEAVILQRWADDTFVYRMDRLPDASWVGLQLELDPTLSVARNEGGAR